MITTKHLEIKKTARYYTYGQPTKQTKYLWIACHGYGQLASNFIKNFEGFDPKLHYVVAPEGLSRFYWGGFTGKPVASWMTAEDRLHEIKDYVNYLNDVYEKAIAEVGIAPENLLINVLGFSQGTATVSRWTTLGKAKVDNLFIWGGNIAHDLVWDKAVAILNNLQLHVIYGLKDPFISPAQVEKQRAFLAAKEIKYQTITYDDKHIIHRPTLLQLANALEKDS